MLTLLGVHNFLSLYQVSVRFEWYINNNNWPLSVWQECFKIKTFRFKDENATTSTRFDLSCIFAYSQNIDFPESFIC